MGRAVFTLQQFELGGARQSVHALELVRKSFQGRKQAVEAAELLRAALARNGLKRSARAQPLGDRALFLQLALCRTDRRKIERNAENKDPDAENSGGSQRVQPFLGALHRLLLKAACTPNWIGREGSSTWT
jgi:hypothetical protein